MIKMMVNWISWNKQQRKNQQKHPLRAEAILTSNIQYYIPESFKA